MNENDAFGAAVIGIPLTLAIASIIRGDVDFGIGLNGLARGGIALAVGLVVIAVVGWGRLGRRTTGASGRPVGGRMVTVHGHDHGGGDGELIATHEGGHVAGAEGVGGYIDDARIWDGGGIVHAWIPDDPQSVITFLYSGQVAAGTGRGADADNANIRKELRGVPAGERAAVKAAGKAHARAIVSRRRRRINDARDQLLRNGHAR